MLLLLPTSYRSALYKFVTVATVVLMTSVSRQVTAHCPHDVESATRHCLDEHHSFLQNIQQTEAHFFAGIDAEYIRTLCHEFKAKSMHCVKTIQRSCPEGRHHSIESALRPYVAFINMCYDQHFIEDYAMIQNCLYSRRSQTDICYRKFLTDTANYEAWGNQHSAVLSYCRSLAELTTCVQSKTRLCNVEKTNKLVSMLVSVSVNLSFKCSDGALGTPTATSTHRASNNDAKKSSSTSLTFSTGSGSLQRPSQSLLCLLQTTLLTGLICYFSH
jgi:hypothetical protein